MSGTIKASIAVSPPLGNQQLHFIQAPAAWMRQRFLRVWQALLDDWQSTRALSFVLILLCISAASISMYYLNHPQVDVSADTQNYVNEVNDRILAGKGVVDPLRTPGYPLFITLIWLVAGRGNLFAVSLVQAGLFVLTTLEVYALTLLVFRRSWIALIVGVLVGTNTYLLAYAKALVVESLALWLVTTLALAVVLFLYRAKVLDLWLIALLTLFTFMTRPEWAYVSVLLFAYLLFIAWRRGKFRRLLPHALAAVVVLNAALGLYIYVNATQNGFPGVTVVQRINLVGKVIQYGMQNEAPPQYAAVVQQIDAYLANHSFFEESTFGDAHPLISNNDWAVGNDYATTVITQHPLQFLLESVPAMFSSFDNFTEFSYIHRGQSFALPLFGFYAVTVVVDQSYRLFPLFALFWLSLWCWPRAWRLRLMETMSALVLIGMYELVLTTLGGYIEMGRLHVPFDPLMIVVIWGSLLASIPLWRPRVARWIFGGNGSVTLRQK